MLPPVLVRPVLLYYGLHLFQIISLKSEMKKLMKIIILGSITTLDNLGLNHIRFMKEFSNLLKLLMVIQDDRFITLKCLIYHAENIQT